MFDCSVLNLGKGWRFTAGFSMSCYYGVVVVVVVNVVVICTADLVFKRSPPYIYFYHCHTVTNKNQITQWPIYSLSRRVMLISNNTKVQ